MILSTPNLNQYLLFPMIEQGLEKLDKSKRIFRYGGVLFAAKAHEHLTNNNVKKANKLFKKSFQEYGDSHIAGNYKNVCNARR